MRFCPTCGRPRNADNRFCSGCGHEFREPGADGGTPLTAEAPGEATRLDHSVDDTRWDAPVDATRLEPPAGGFAWPSGKPGLAAEARLPAEPRPPAEPDPFAAWFAPEASAPGPEPAPGPTAGQPAAPVTGPDDRWQSADTVYAMPAAAYRPPPQAAQHPPTAQPGPGWPAPQVPGFPPPGPGYGGRSRRPSRGARTALIIAVVLVVLGAGGAAYALISRSNRSSASPPSTATAAASATASASASATPSASASASTSGSPSASPSPSATVSASPSPSLVRVASGVGSNPATPQVEKVLSHFFQGINTRSYPEYAGALDSQQRAQQTQSSFRKGYATTTDSGMTLTSLTSTGSGGLAATVTFTSHQSASSSVDNSTCNNWTLTFYLVPNGTGYLDGVAPSGYQPRYSDC